MFHFDFSKLTEIEPWTGPCLTMRFLNYLNNIFALGNVRYRDFRERLWNFWLGNLIGNKGVSLNICICMTIFILDTREVAIKKRPQTHYNKINTLFMYWWVTNEVVNIVSNRHRGYQQLHTAIEKGSSLLYFF